MLRKFARLPMAMKIELRNTIERCIPVQSDRQYLMMNPSMDLSLPRPSIEGTLNSDSLLSGSAYPSSD